MNTSRLTVPGVAVLTALALTATSFAAAELPLVRDGKAACAVITGKDAPWLESHAAGEFARYVKAMTGAELPFRTDPSAAPEGSPRVLIGTYIASGFFAAFAGLYMTARICCGDPAVGAPYQMHSIAAAVLGGTALTGGRGGMGGTVIGVILLAMLGNIFNLMDINIYWQNILRGVILVGVVAFSQIRVAKSKEAAKLLQ